MFMGVSGMLMTVIFKVPSTRREFWIKKFETNRRNDIKAVDELLSDKWRVCIVWECAIRGRSKLPLSDVLNLCSNWLKSEVYYYVI